MRQTSSQRRDVIHHLTSTRCARLSTAPIPVYRPHIDRTIETWVSVFPGVLFRYFWVSHGVALSSMVIDVQAIQLFPYWQRLRSHLGYPTSPHAASLPGCVSPWRFRSFRVRETRSRDVWELPSTFYEGDSSHRETAHLSCALFC